MQWKNSSTASSLLEINDYIRNYISGDGCHSGMYHVVEHLHQRVHSKKVDPAPVRHPQDDSALAAGIISGKSNELAEFRRKDPIVKAEIDRMGLSR
jgi:hypothetical protein